MKTRLYVAFIFQDGSAIPIANNSYSKSQLLDAIKEVPNACVVESFAIGQSMLSNVTMAAKLMEIHVKEMQ